ncbi:hypothetical protein N2384_01590 [Bacillus paralicheniformis]|uniref:hypothetical protein n=1 Tax=Bacillus paralicheniformis TaxID=1648923 RepID=UPI0021A6E14E|nr:hypothetical protein [Bacillus paralicheniformis]UWS61949.1 hypothetical protein N2384_01590 [Bacillus paralicheniformis]
MKKTDLKVGEIYAYANSNPRLLLHKGIWLAKGHYGDRWLLLETGTQPRKNVGYFHSAQGVLVATGADHTAISKWYSDNPWISDLLEVIESGRKVKYHHRDTIDDIVQSGREHGVRVVVDDYRRWVGAFEDVKREREELEARTREERARLDNLYEGRHERAARIKRVLQDKYGIEKTATHMKLVHGRHGSQRVVADGITLSLSDLEDLLGLSKNEEK